LHLDETRHSAIEHKALLFSTPDGPHVLSGHFIKPFVFLNSAAKELAGFCCCGTDKLDLMFQEK